MVGDVIQDAEKAAHLSDRGVSFLLFFIFSAAIAYLFRDAKKTAERVAQERATSMERIITKMDQRSEAMDVERRQRIEMLLGVIRDNTTAKTSMAEAVTANTHAIGEIKQTIEQLLVTLKVERKPNH